jgi:hypothetical protein
MPTQQPEERRRALEQQQRAAHPGAPCGHPIKHDSDCRAGEDGEIDPEEDKGESLGYQSYHNMRKPAQLSIDQVDASIGMWLFSFQPTYNKSVI